MTNLTEGDLAAIGSSPITIRSAHFENVYLRMDGSGVTTQTSNGGGTVNCSPGVSSYGKFRLWRQGDGSYSVESVAFPNVYLRMTAKGFTAPADQGGGLVNCQFNARGGTDEKFRLRQQPDGSFALESTSFPNVYLRMDGSGVAAAPGGTVNCQFSPTAGVDLYERFFLAPSDQPDRPALDFRGQPQQRTNWCWSACSVSVERFYRPASEWTQCRLATALAVDRGYQGVQCCPPPPMPGAGDGPCNEGSWPDRPMALMGLAHRVFNRPLTVAEISAELALGRPILVDLHWRVGGFLWPGHIVVVYGYQSVAGEDRLVIYDPGNGGSVQNYTYDNFRLQYSGNGEWVNSYTTQP
jgi:hypothetical protein